MAAIGFFTRDFLIKQYEYTYCGSGTPFDPGRTKVLLLRAGTTISEPINKAVVIGDELVVAGYSRKPLAIVVAEIAANTITTESPHRLYNNFPIFFDSLPGDSVPAGITANTKYFVRDATTSTFKVASTPSGSPLTISGGTCLIIPGAIYDPIDQRIESTTIDIPFLMTSAGQYGGVALLAEGDSNHSFTISSINTDSGAINTTTAHGLTTGSPVVINTDSGGTQPGGVSPTTVYFARGISSTEFTIHTTAAGASANTDKIVPSSAGSGTRRLRLAAGEIIGFYAYPAPISFFENQAFTVPIFLAKTT